MTRGNTGTGRPSGSRNAWDASLYDGSFAIISQLGAGVLELLAPRPGERILDLGCGTGQLTAGIAAAGADAIGVDAAQSMVERARAQLPGLRFVVGRGESFALDAAVDAVFSNAALHWMFPPEQVVARIFVRDGHWLADYRRLRFVAVKPW
ncbi:MAG: methyltransferase domain-containing protein [Chloroflexota bacterium]|nr:methyltransferase domain-containing protein [Chloroflexota bacterium]